ncbi:MAG: molybdenum cofactor biosynthesis protein MoaE [Flavobacteriia bacterium]|jgi:molybdopterin synthase catalytic subunit|nr:molybdenum cofactor biosynthesis protein MoaE [Flavobacteriia bacterium]
MKERVKNIFIEGPISPAKIGESIAHHQSKTKIGAHALFLGQVRADTVEGKTVEAIEYTAQTEIANQVCHEIREEAFSQYELSCMHIYHSLGVVKKGEICFFVFVSSGHRTPVFDSLNELVNKIKARVPVFGKELFEDQSHQWKVNQ